MATDFAAIINRLLSSSLQGQQELFDRFTASSPIFRNITPIAQRALDREFGPLSARYVTEAALPGNESNLGNFSDFISQNIGGGPPRGQSLNQALQGTRGLFGDTPLSANDEIRRRALENDIFGRQIIEAATQEGVNPILQQFLPGVLARRFSEFQNANPNTPLFSEFVRRGFTF